jgi:hypothetical protein
MENDLETLIQYYYEKKKQGTDFSEIRKEMEMKNFAPEKISEIIRKVDNKILKEHDKPQSTKDYRKLRYAGYILMLAGGILIVANYVHWINLKGNYYWAFILVVGGYLLVNLERLILKKQKNLKK